MSKGVISYKRKLKFVDLITEMVREIKLRQKCYPRWINDSKNPLTRNKANRQLLSMEKSKDILEVIESDAKLKAAVLIRLEEKYSGKSKTTGQKKLNL